MAKGRSSLAVLTALVVPLVALTSFLAHQANRVDVLLVGDVTIDIVPDGKAAGGSITYAAAVLNSLGIKACVVTAAGQDADLSVFKQHELHVVPANATLTFEHTYTWWGHSRKLRVTADPNITLSRHHVPKHCQRARLVMLGPLTLNDVDAQSFLTYDSPLDMLWRGPQQHIAYMAQGTQRQLGSKGAVLPLNTPSHRLLDGLGPQVSLFLSDVETTPWPVYDVARVAAAAQRLLVTRGEKGAEEYNATGAFQVAAMPVDTVKDTNGAGDTFATMYALSLAWGAADPAYIASYAASRAVQQPQSCKPACVGNHWAHLSQQWPISLKLWMDLKALVPHLWNVGMFALQPYEPVITGVVDSVRAVVGSMCRRLAPSLYTLPLHAHQHHHHHGVVHGAAGTAIPPPGGVPKPSGSQTTWSQGEAPPHKAAAIQPETAVPVTEKNAHVGGHAGRKPAVGGSIPLGAEAKEVHVRMSDSVMGEGASTGVVVQDSGVAGGGAMCGVECPAGGRAGRQRSFRQWMCDVVDSVKGMWVKTTYLPQLPGSGGSVSK